MTATLTRMPMAAGGAALSALGYGLIWVAVRVVKAPVNSLVLAAMTVGTAFAATNALYLQLEEHPSPMFADKPIVTATATPAKTVVTTPVKTVSAPQKKKPEIVPLVTSSVPKSAPKPVMHEDFAKIGNADVKVLQQKLIDLKFYDGEADGFYGPKTASAIREFEKSNGLPIVGALTPDLLDAVAKARIKQEPQATVTKLPAPEKIKPASKVVTPKKDVAKIEPAPKTDEPSPSVSKPDPLVEIVQRVASAAQKSVSTPKQPESAQLVEKVQRGLSSLGFLRGKIDGIAGEATAKAIRNFEVYYNYEVTGAATPELIDLLAQAGADTD